MLKQNTTIYAQYPLRYMSGALIAKERVLWGQDERRNFYCGEAGIDPKCAIPNGNLAPAVILMAQKSGGMASYKGVAGVGMTSSVNLAGGKNGSATFSGLGQITNADLALIVSAVAMITASGYFATNPIIQGKLEAAATLAGMGDVTAALIAFGDAVATILADASLEADIRADGYMDATVYVNAGSADVAQMVSGVWDALAENFDGTGTMGSKMNDAGAAGDPWNTELPGSYTGSQAGNILAFIKSIEGGRWKIVANQMIFYAADNVTEVARFNLLDGDGAPAETGVMERTRA